MSALAVWMGTVMRFWRKSLDCLHLLCVGLVLKAASEHTHTRIHLVEMKPINASTQWIPKYFTPVMQVRLNLQNLLWHHKELFLIYRDQMPSYLLSTASTQLFEVPPILPHLPILFRAYYQASLTGSDQGKNRSKIYRNCVLQKLWSEGRMMLSRKLMCFTFRYLRTDRLVLLFSSDEEVLQHPCPPWWFGPMLLEKGGGLHQKSHPETDVAVP